jgi:hypothetical protein
MATKSKPKSHAAPRAKQGAAKPKTCSEVRRLRPAMFTMPDTAHLAKYAKTLTPQEAFELYRAMRGSRSM